MLIVQILLFSTSYRTLNSQNDQYYYLKTQGLSSRFYAQLAQFREIAIKISSDSEISAKKLASSSNHPASMLQISKELKAISFMAPLAQNIGLYYPDLEIFLDSEYYYTVDTFCASFANGNSDVREQCRRFFTNPMDGKFQIISSTFGKSVLSESASDGKMLLIFPVRMNSYTEYDAAVYFILSHQSIEAFLSASSPAENYTYAIFGEKGRLLFTNNLKNQEEFVSERFQDYLTDPMQITYDFQDQSTTAYKWSEPTGSNIFVNIVGESALEETSRNFLMTMQIVIIINLLVVAALLVLTVYINYNPLRKLVSRVASGQKGSASELDYLEQTIRELDTRASDQGVAIMDYVLNDLLYGMTVRQPELERLIPNFHFRYFCAVSVMCSPPTSAQAKQIASWIEAETGCRIYITDIPNREESLFVCLSQDSIDKEKLSSAILEGVHQVFEDPCSIFVGSIVTKLDDISVSYYDSQAQMGAADASSADQNYPSAQLHLLEAQLSSGNISGGLDTVNSIFEFINDHRHDRIVCRYICYDLLRTVISSRKKTACPMEPDEIRELLHFKNEEDLHESLKRSLTATGERITSLEPPETASLQRELAAYVDQNFTHPDISLVSAADRFGISIYMVSRLFKTQTGTGFKEYITAKRLELASRLLLTSQDTISTIAQKVGFENPTYFASLFRTHYGTAPSKYRENNLDPEETEGDAT